MARRSPLRTVAMIALLVGIAGCGNAPVVVSSTVIEATTTTDPLLEPMEEVQAAMTEVALSLTAIGLDDIEEAMLAWSDLSTDLDSSLKDLKRDPNSVDVPGLEARIHSFQDQFSFEANSAWDHLVDSFDLFVEELGVASS